MLGTQETEGSDLTAGTGAIGVKSRIALLEKRVERHLARGRGSSDVLDQLAEAKRSLDEGDGATAHDLYALAEASYDELLYSRRKLLFLIGLTCSAFGFFPFLVFLCWIWRLLRGQTAQDAYPWQHAIYSISLFSTLGAVASVLTRIGRLQISRESSSLLMIAEGAARPVVSFIFAFVVWLMMADGLVTIKIGSESGAGAAEGGEFVAAFFCGFSERFVRHVFTLTGLASDTARADPPPATVPPPAVKGKASIATRANQGRDASRG